MSEKSQKILEEAMTLPSDEREILAHQLFGSVMNEPKEEGYDEAWEKEIEKRLKDIDEGKAVFLSHEQVIKEIRERRKFGN